MPLNSKHESIVRPYESKAERLQGDEEISGTKTKYSMLKEVKVHYMQKSNHLIIKRSYYDLSILCPENS